MLYHDWWFTVAVSCLILCAGLAIVFGFVEDIAGWLGAGHEEQRRRKALQRNLHEIVERLCEDDDPILWEAFFACRDNYRAIA